VGKLPAIQFYPADWRKDPGVQALDYFERGVWFEMLLIMHESKNRGFLEINDKKIEKKMLAKMLGITAKKTEKVLKTLEFFDVYSISDYGVIYCRRMVYDEHIRQVRIKAGKTGGDANASNLLKQNDKQNDPPSSSSSTSSTSSKSTEAKASDSSEPKKLTQSKRIQWNGQTFDLIIPDDMTKWAKAYPACNIETELCQMEAWLVANPKKSIKSNYARFITAWLSKSQDRGGGTKSSQKAQDRFSGLTPASKHPDTDYSKAYANKK